MQRGSKAHPWHHPPGNGRVRTNQERQPQAHVEPVRLQRDRFNPRLESQCSEPAIRVRVSSK